MADGAKGSGWWHTLPGVLTALGGTMTAAAGLLVALHQVGLFDTGGAPPTVVEPPAADPAAGRPDTVGAAVPPTPPEATPDAPARDLPVAGREARVGSATVQLLAGERAPAGDAQLVRFEVRVLNTHPSVAFAVDARTFRLVADGEPLAPRRLEFARMVPPDAAERGRVAFEAPAVAGRLALRVRDVRGGVMQEIPVPLQAAPPGRSIDSLRARPGLDAAMRATVLRDRRVTPP